MKIAIASDLHLEFGQEISFDGVTADVLVLAGDVIVAAALAGESARHLSMTELYTTVIGNACKNFKKVVYIMGNHEFYHSTLEETKGLVENFMSQWDNLVFLDDSVVEIDGVNFVGSVLWSDTNSSVYAAFSKKLLGDFSVIRETDSKFLTLNTYQRMHESCVDFVKYSCEGNKKTVVVTHHAPSPRSVSSQFIGSDLNCFFYSKLDEWIEYKENIVLWIHGHMHNKSSYRIGKTTVVCNPIGYPNENKNISIKVVDI